MNTSAFERLQIDFIKEIGGIMLIWDNGKELKKQLILLEKLKVGIMKQINLYK